MWCEVAKQSLMQKKRLEVQLGQLDGQLTNLQMQREALERAVIDQEVLNEMIKAKEAIKRQFANMYCYYYYTCVTIVKG